MSDKGPLNDHETGIRATGSVEKEKPAIGKEPRLCITCKTKPTISKNSPYCASCMAVKGNKMRRQKATVPLREEKPKKTKEDTQALEKASHDENMSVVIDFTKWPAMLKQLQEIADDQIRPIDSQILFILKSIVADPRSKTIPDPEAI